MQTAMVRSLRKYHFIFWRALVLILPLLFILALVVRPSAVRSVRDANENVSFHITTESDSTSIVELDVMKPLTVPSCVVLLSHRGVDRVLGLLNYQGVYRYSIRAGEPTDTLKLYDAIRKKVLRNVPWTSIPTNTDR